ncbi:hypothetical protein D3C85_1448440 [compost metagenome]
MRLHIDVRDFRINAGSQIKRRYRFRILAQRRRILGDRDGMQIHHHEETFVLILQFYEILNSTDIIAECQ